MKRLVLMRHAKSSWKSDAPNDLERPLSGRGERDAPRVAARIAELGFAPELVISSDAVRTKQTFKRMRELLGGPEVVFEHRLYMGGTDEVRAAIRSAPDHVTRLLVLGHNPGWEDALAWLSGSPDELKTANAALLESEASSWSEAVAVPERFQLLAVVRPREISRE